MQLVIFLLSSFRQARVSQVCQGPAGTRKYRRRGWSTWNRLREDSWRSVGRWIQLGRAAEIGLLPSQDASHLWTYVSSYAKKKPSARIFLDSLIVSRCFALIWWKAKFRNVFSNTSRVLASFRWIITRGRCPWMAHWEQIDRWRRGCDWRSDRQDLGNSDSKHRQLGRCLLWDF